MKTEIVQIKLIAQMGSSVESGDLPTGELFDDDVLRNLSQAAERMTQSVRAAYEREFNDKALDKARPGVPGQ